MKFHHLPIILALSSSTVINAGCTHEKHIGGIHAKPHQETAAEFDIVHAKISTKGNIVTFHMKVSGKAGVSKPTPTGQLAGSKVFSYVWPTTIDSYEVGFEKKTGILALAVTAHPDFDDHTTI